MMQKCDALHIFVTYNIDLTRGAQDLCCTFSFIHTFKKMLGFTVAHVNKSIVDMGGMIHHHWQV